MALFQSKEILVFTRFDAKSSIFFQCSSGLRQTTDDKGGGARADSVAHHRNFGSKALFGLPLQSCVLPLSVAVCSQGTSMLVKKHNAVL
jgi:hypothetical protein